MLLRVRRLWVEEKVAFLFLLPASVFLPYGAVSPYRIANFVRWARLCTPNFAINRER